MKKLLPVMTSFTAFLLFLTCFMPIYLPYSDGRFVNVFSLLNTLPIAIVLPIIWLSAVVVSLLRQRQASRITACLLLVGVIAALFINGQTVTAVESPEPYTSITLFGLFIASILAIANLVPLNKLTRIVPQRSSSGAKLFVKGKFLPISELTADERKKQRKRLEKVVWQNPLFAAFLTTLGLSEFVNFKSGEPLFMTSTAMWVVIYGLVLVFASIIVGVVAKRTAIQADTTGNVMIVLGIGLFIPILFIDFTTPSAVQFNTYISFIFAAAITIASGLVNATNLIKQLKALDD